MRSLAPGMILPQAADAAKSATSSTGSVNWCLTDEALQYELRGRTMRQLARWSSQSRDRCVRLESEAVWAGCGTRLGRGWSNWVQTISSRKPLPAPQVGLQSAGVLRPTSSTLMAPFGAQRWSISSRRQRTAPPFKPLKRIPHATAIRRLTEWIAAHRICGRMAHLPHVRWDRQVSRCRSAFLFQTSLSRASAR